MVVKVKVNRLVTVIEAFIAEKEKNYTLEPLNEWTQRVRDWETAAKDEIKAMADLLVKGKEVGRALPFPPTRRGPQHAHSDYRLTNAKRDLAFLRVADPDSTVNVGTNSDYASYF